MPDDLCRLSARAVVDLLRWREVSPLDLIDAAAARIEVVDGTVNALPTLCLDRARDRARSLMATPPPEEPVPGYLFGLPIAVKDLSAVAGVRFTQGSPIFAETVPTRSDIMVERLEAKGAIVIAKSNTPEFGAGANTFNEVFGATRNPWDTTKTCGGSSGGSAVALATGQVWLATGSDLGGSLRIPASYCSVVGFRPSPGRVAKGPGQLPFAPLSVNGPMGRDVADAALLLDAQSGQHPEDPLSLPAPAQSFQEAIAQSRPSKRIAWSADLGIAPVDQEVRDICASAVRWFETDGAVVEEAHPDLHDASSLFQILRAHDFAATRGALLDKHRDQLKPEVVWNIEKGLSLDVQTLARAQRDHGSYYHRFTAFFQDFDLLCTPCVMAPPFDLDIRYLEEVEGVRFDNYVDWLMLTYAITLTTCPAISIPAGFTTSGLPVGLQIVGPPRADAAVLAAAARFEAAHGIPQRLPVDP